MTSVDRRPRRPRDLTAHQLGFTPRKPVAWLSPSLLLGTALRLFGMHFFGAYLDKRELQAGLPAHVPDHSGQADADGDFWFDYTADTGDGFDATYSIAYLMAQPELRVGHLALPRGRLLVVGGDEVYPGPSTDGYRDRFTGPYRSALPSRTDDPPALYALPGNHDWYDGLTAFLRIFAKDGWVGGWRLRQSRSYFALRLPGGWWLFAVDMSLTEYIDEPQLRYFESVADQVAPEDRIILATPEPAWISNSVKSPDSYNSVDFFLRKVVEPTGAICPLILSGDLHHYSRYVPDPEPGEPDTSSEVSSTGPDTMEEPAAPDTSRMAASPAIAPQHLIGAGGGGAFLGDTAHLPDRTSAPAPGSMRRNNSPVREYRLAERYPSAATSRRLGWGILGRLLIRNPGFAVMMGVVHTLLMFAFLADRDRWLTPATVATGGLVLLGAIGWAGRAGGWHNRVVGAFHGLAHIGLAMLGTYLWWLLPLDDLEPPWSTLTAIAIYGPIGAVVGTQLVAVYLLIAGQFGINLTEKFAAQGIADYKCFLRMRISSDGALEIFPIGLDDAGRTWSVDADGPEGSSWIKPTDPLRPHLIEHSIRIDSVDQSG